MTDLVTFQDLFNHYRGNPMPSIHIQFKDRIDDWETYFEGGMMADIISMELDRNSECVKLRCNVKPYDDYNITFESSNYYDPFGEPRLTAREAGYHPMRSNWCEEIYMDLNDDITNVMTILEPSVSELRQEHLDLPDPKPSYIDWLEKELLAARANKFIAAEG